MKLQAISSVNGVTQNYNTNSVQKTKKQNFSAPQNYPQNIISFKGNNPDHVIFACAELKGMQQVGGVATVTFDYANMPHTESAFAIPYYNGKLVYDEKGQYTDVVQVHKFPEGHEHAGKPFWTNADLNKTTLQEVYNNPDKYVLLDEIATKTTPWDSTKSATLYRISEKGRIKGVDRDIFLIFTDSLAVMKEPYADGSYSSKTAKQVGEAAAKEAFKPQPYAEFGRMYVEFEDDIIKNTRTSSGVQFSPMTVSCSDAQTAYIPYYMRAKGKQSVLPIYTLHNGGDGYTGQTSGKIMFQNLLIAEDEATRTKTLRNLLQNEDFIIAELTGKSDEFFKKYMPELVDDSKCFNPTFIPFLYARKQDGYVKGVNTVSKGYAEALAFNENIPSGIRKFWKSLYKDGQAIGILNPMNDTSFTPFKEGGSYLPGYNTAYTIKYADGREEIIPAFRTLDINRFKDASGNIDITEDTLKHADEVKLDNQINFLKRFTGIYDADNFTGQTTYKGETIKGEKVRNLLINGLDNKDIELIGHISPETIAKFEEAKAAGKRGPQVFVSWGRIDGQKALDSVMNAFRKHAQTHPDSVLVLGGPPLVDSEGNVADCTKSITELAAKYADEPGLKGRLVFMSGFAPNKVLASVADAAVFPSRFAPCELTDLESMKYLLRVIAANCQGLSDKNFDANTDGIEKATGYKTIHEFFGVTDVTAKQDREISKLFLEGDSIERLTGFQKLYKDAELEYLTRTENSGISYRGAVVTNLEKEIEGLISKEALTSATEKLAKLKLSAEEALKLKGLSIADENDKALVQKFAQNKKLTESETAKLVSIINSAQLEDTEKVRFTNLLNGSTRATVENELIDIIIDSKNLKDKNVKLTGGDITESEIKIIKTYLADVTQANRKALDDALIVTGKLDESQVSVLKRIFNYDPVLNYIHDTGKFNKKYVALIERCRNAIMEKELFQCMERCANETPANRVKMMLHHFNLNCTWDGNQNLTGITRQINGVETPVSSRYLYGEFMARTRTDEQSKVGYTSFLQKLMDAIQPKNSNKSGGNAMNNAIDAAEDAVKKSSGMSKGMKIALGAGAALLALGGAFYVMNKSGSKTNEHGDKFQPRTQTNKAPNNTAATKANNPAQKGANPAQKQPALNPYLATK